MVEPARQEVAAPETPAPTLSKNELRRLQAALAQLEEQIGAAEYQLEQLAHATQEATQSERFDMIRSLSVEYSATEEKLESLMHEWEKLAHELAQAAPEKTPQAEVGSAAIST